MDLLKIIEDSPIEPEWHEYEFAGVDGTRRVAEFQIQYLDTVKSDMVLRKSKITVHNKQKHTKETDVDQARWRMNVMRESLKAWRNLSYRNALELALVNKDAIDAAELAAKVTGENIDDPYAFNQPIAEQIMKRNTSWAVWVGNTATANSSEYAANEAEEKKI